MSETTVENAEPKTARIEDFYKPVEVPNTDFGCPVTVFSNGERVWMGVDGKSASVNGVLMSFRIELAFDKDKGKWGQHLRRADGSFQYLTPFYSRADWSKEVSEAGKRKAVSICINIIDYVISKNPNFLEGAKLEDIRGAIRRSDYSIREAELKLKELRDKRDKELQSFKAQGATLGISDGDLNQIITSITPED